MLILFLFYLDKEYNLDNDLFKKNIESPVTNLLEKMNFIDIDQLAMHICSLDDSEVSSVKEIVNLEQNIDECDEECQCDSIVINNDATIIDTISDNNSEPLVLEIENNISTIKQITDELINEAAVNEINPNQNQTLSTTIVPSKYFKDNNESNGKSTKKQLKRTWSNMNENKNQKSTIKLPNVDKDNYIQISDNNEINLSKKFQNTNTINKTRMKSYSDEEDSAILNYIIKHGRYYEIKGRQLWQDMESDRACNNRSWQSMKERFRKNILPKINDWSELHQLDEEIVDYFNSQATLNVSNRTFSEHSGGYTHEEDQGKKN